MPTRTFPQLKRDLQAIAFKITDLEPFLDRDELDEGVSALQALIDQAEEDREAAEEEDSDDDDEDSDDEEEDSDDPDV